MSLKVKLTTTIAALCMVICLLTVGVWAATKGTVNLHGTVSFTAKDVSVRVYGAISGTDATNGDNVGKTDISTIVAAESDDAFDATQHDQKIAVWDASTSGEILTADWGTTSDSLNLLFASKESTIKLVIKVENTNAERSVKYTFAPELKGVKLTSEETEIKYTDGVEKSTNVKATYTTTGTTVTDAEKGEGTIAPSTTANFVITLTIANRNNSVNSVPLTGSMVLENVEA